MVSCKFMNDHFIFLENERIKIFPVVPKTEITTPAKYDN